MTDLSLDRSTAGAAARLRHWSKPETALVPVSEVGELSDEQREAVLAWFGQHPSGGYKAALRQIGVRASSAEAKQLLLSDEAVRATRLEGWGLSERSVMAGIGEIVGDETHKDRFNALRFAASVLHGFRESQGVEIDVAHTGTVVVEHERRKTLNDVLAFARAIDGSGDGAGGELPAARSLLPAPEDG
jgi:hypothetical protein